VFLQTTGALYCLQDPQKEPGGDPPPALPGETEGDPAPFHVQVVPADVLLRPGQSCQFVARLFNEQGQFLREANATFRLEGPGTLSSEGLFEATGSEHARAIVQAQVGSRVGQAQVRVVPALPWRFSFDSVSLDPQRATGEPPVTWVGARHRHVVRDLDGERVMVKITTIPKGTRSRCWFGQSDLHDYTIQADVRGARQDSKMPDIGLIAQGYTLDLQGAHQKLQIRTWVPQLRMANTIDFSWQPDRWYTMKLRAEVKDGVGILRGKVWPRENSEPGDWTLEARDPSPNVAGSPGLYGNAKDAEIYLDNLVVTPN
jgi:hypothetical protein